MDDKLVKYKRATQQALIEHTKMIQEVEAMAATMDQKDKEAWAEIVAHIERFLSADAYLISTPMWNFSIPYTLKHYIDIIVQPKYLFRYAEKGVEGPGKR